MSVGLPNLAIVSRIAFGCLLFAIVLKMAIIDCREMILPNRLNFLLACGGIGQAAFLRHPDLTNAALGALFGFAVLGAVAALFHRIRGIDGLGGGDQKFLASAGFWIGWQQIAPMLLIASCSALAFVTIRSVKQRKLEVQERVPFGPFLGFGTLVCWLITAVSGS